MPETLSHLFDRTASRWPEREAVLFVRKGRPESRLTFSALRKISNRVANSLPEKGFRKGDRVFLLMPKSLEQVVLHLGIQKAGGVSVLLNPGFKKEEIGYFLDDADPSVVFAGKDQEALVRSIAGKRPVVSVDTEAAFTEEKIFSGASSKRVEPERSPADPAILIYTSGTTGKPKGAILTQQNLMRDAEHIVRIWEMTERDVLCHALPLFHVHGLCFALHTSLIAGVKVVMCDEFSPETVIDLLSRKDGDLACTLFMGVPTMYLRMMDVLRTPGGGFRHLRLLTCGSAPLLPKDFERIHRIFGQEPVEREGMSETGMNFSNPLRGRKKPGSIGLPLPDVEVRIVRPETREDVKPGEVGEIWLKGPNVTPGYWRKPKETEAAFVDEWFRTGDLGKRDEDGYYTLTDRLKHIIISGGENISPKEIESVLNRHQAVSESCVVGVPDEKWGEKVVAAVVAKPGLSPSELEMRDHCKAHLLDWKCPKEIRFLNELPRNKMGKVVKEEVEKLFSPPCDDVLPRLQKRTQSD
jgi:malonyl-CoA/methylmalonyl-CoA synthetase